MNTTDKEKEKINNITKSKKDKIKALIFYGNIPSKKNSRINITGKSKKGKRYTKNIPSKNYKEWHKKMSKQKKMQNEEYIKKIQKKNFEKIELTIFFPTKRKADLTNKAESIMDFLVDSEILEDDNWKETGPITMIPRYRKNLGGFMIKIKSGGKN